tara:strand:+ start:2601 stop:3350 length:750 start_codon:yes stop_codon:yes gene_type:complete
MINGKKVLAYIPARSGSKGIKDKNIIPLFGKPLIAYSIESARKSKYVDEVIVSTDSEKYAEVSREYGANVPFIRPSELATDLAKEMDTTLHLIKWVEDNLEEKYDYIIRLQCTSPLRTSEDIDKAIELMEEKGADSIISVNECLVTPVWTNTLPEDLSMKDFIKPEYKYKNRQELPIFYQLNGSVFIAKWELIKEKGSWYYDKSYACILPKENSIDIDEEMDLLIASTIMKKKKDEEQLTTTINNNNLN